MPKNSERSSELYNRAGEEAMGAMKGKLAAKYYELAAEVEGEGEGEGEGKGEEEEERGGKGESDVAAGSISTSPIRRTCDDPIGVTPLKQSAEVGEKEPVKLVIPLKANDDEEDEDLFAGLGEAAGAMDGEEEGGGFDDLAAAMGGL